MKRRLDPDDRHVKRLATDLSLLSLGSQERRPKANDNLNDDLNDDDMHEIKVHNKFLQIPDHVLHTSDPDPPRLLPENNSQQLVLYRPVSNPRNEEDTDEPLSKSSQSQQTCQSNNLNQLVDDEAMQIEE